MIIGITGSGQLDIGKTLSLQTPGSISLAISHPLKEFASLLGFYDFSSPPVHKLIQSMRHVNDSDLWVDLWVHAYNKTYSTYKGTILVDDVQTARETDVLRSLGGLIIYTNQVGQGKDHNVAERDCDHIIYYGSTRALIEDVTEYIESISYLSE